MSKKKNVCKDKYFEDEAGRRAIVILKAMCFANKTLRHIITRVIETMCDDPKSKTLIGVKSILMQKIIHSDYETN